MAYDYEGRGQDIQVKGTTYRIPKDEDIADAPKAFEDYTNSIPFSEYVEVVNVDTNTTVDDSFNGKMIVATSPIELTLNNDLPDGFTLAAVAESNATIAYFGVDKVDEMTIAYEVATVVTVNGTNILSVARGGDIIVDGGVAEGTPPAPVITNPDGGTVISFTSGGEGDAGSTLAYGATIEPEDGATVEVDQDNLEVKVLGTTPFTDYVVSVYGVNMAGAGEKAKTNDFQLNYNEATGGTETIVNNYRPGEKWKIHTFSSVGNDTFTVGTAINDFRVLVVGGGGGGGRTDGNGWSAGTGGGGAVHSNDTLTLTTGAHTLTVGNGGGPGGAGGTTTFQGLPACSGGVQGSNAAGTTGAGGASGNGNAGAPVGNSGAGGGTGGNYTINPNGIGSDISGIPVQYGAGRGGAGGYGCGGSSNGGANVNGNPGVTGAVIVAYQIGTSTTREIAQAQAKQEARAAGVEEGIEQGKQQGYAQATRRSQRCY